MGGVKAIILVGGPSKVAGQELILHHMEACRKIDNLTEILLMGFYNDAEAPWQAFLKKTRESMGVPVKGKSLWNCGRPSTLQSEPLIDLTVQNEILSGDPSHLVLMHCDILCSFPLLELLQFHQKHGKEITMLGKEVPKEEATKYGCVAVDRETSEALHYAEKPETFIGETINAGIYILSPSFFDLVQEVSKSRTVEDGESEHFLRLEQDILMKVCGEGHVFVYRTPHFWLQLKSAGTVVQAASYLLAHLREVHPERLVKSGDGVTKPVIVGNVLIHPSATIDPSAKIGPNVSIGENVKVGAGVRIQHSIVLDGAEIKPRACVMYSIVGWNSIVGSWARLEGLPDFKADSHDALKCGITILGSGVTVGAESIIRSSIALPHKELSGSYHNLIVL